MQGGSLNSINKFLQTPLYYGSKTLITTLGMQSGVIKVANKAHYVDNSDLLSIETPKFGVSNDRMLDLIDHYYS